MPNESAIEKKIRQFTDEVGDKELTTEQAKVYAAFTKTKGSSTFLNLDDKEGNHIRLKIISNDASCGSQHILLRHYKTKIYYVTATEILNLSEIIKNGEQYKSKSYTVYELKKSVPKGMINEVIKIAKDGKTAVLKTLYSDRKPETKKLSKPASSSPRGGRHRNSGRNAKLEKRGKNTKKTK